MASSVIEIVNIDDNPHDYDDDNQVTFLYETRTISPIKGFSRNNPISIEDYGEYSNSKYEDDDVIFIKEKASTDPTMFTCEICVDHKPIHNRFLIKGCNHLQCSDCIAKYITCKIEENITRVTCPVPECNGLLEPEFCRRILPKQVYDRWGDALCEGLISSSERFYCPFKDCSALLLIDNNLISMKECDCPYCKRLFCLQCKVPWHGGIDCVEFQKLNKDEREKDDIKLMNLAKENRWRRCPSCKFYVEKFFGCMYIKCRCGNTFCYNCGAHLTIHYCTVCKLPRNPTRGLVIRENRDNELSKFNYTKNAGSSRTGVQKITEEEKQREERDLNNLNKLIHDVMIKIHESAQKIEKEVRKIKGKQVLTHSTNNSTNKESGSERQQIVKRRRDARTTQVEAEFSKKKTQITGSFKKLRVVDPIEEFVNKNKYSLLEDENEEDGLTPKKHDNKKNIVMPDFLFKGYFNS